MDEDATDIRHSNALTYPAATPEFSHLGWLAANHIYKVNHPLQCSWVSIRVFFIYGSPDPGWSHILLKPPCYNSWDPFWWQLHFGWPIWSGPGLQFIPISTTATTITTTTITTTTSIIIIIIIISMTMIAGLLSLKSACWFVEYARCILLRVSATSRLLQLQGLKHGPPESLVLTEPRLHCNTGPTVVTSGDFVFSPCSVSYFRKNAPCSFLFVFLPAMADVLMFWMPAMG